MRGRAPPRSTRARARGAAAALCYASACHSYTLYIRWSLRGAGAAREGCPLTVARSVSVCIDSFVCGKVEGAMLIIVHLLNAGKASGRQVSPEVEGDELVEALKAKIAELATPLIAPDDREVVTVAPAHQALRFGDVLLKNDGRTLAQYGLIKESELCVSLRPKARVLRLHVGGSCYYATLDVLRAVEGSTLRAMFESLAQGVSIAEGVPHEALVQAPDGAYLLDHDGLAFRHVLNFLRARRPLYRDGLQVGNASDEFVLPESQGELRLLITEARHLGLPELEALAQVALQREVEQQRATVACLEDQLDELTELAKRRATQAEAQAEEQRAQVAQLRREVGQLQAEVAEVAKQQRAQVAQQNVGELRDELAREAEQHRARATEMRAELTKHGREMQQVIVALTPCPPKARACHCAHACKCQTCGERLNRDTGCPRVDHNGGDWRICWKKPGASYCEAARE